MNLYNADAFLKLRGRTWSEKIQKIEHTGA